MAREETGNGRGAASLTSHHITWELLVADCSGGDEDGWMLQAAVVPKNFKQKEMAIGTPPTNTSNILIQRLPLKASFWLSA